MKSLFDSDVQPARGRGTVQCLSLWQPWASLLVHGLKRVETRGWPMRHRGPLLIHAAKRWNPDLAYVAAGRLFFRPALESIGIRFEATEAAARRGWGLPFGAVIGSVNVVNCYRTEAVGVNRYAPFEGWELDDGDHRHDPTARSVYITPTEHAFGDYSPGRFAILCDSFFAFDDPIPYRGAQGLFGVPAHLLPTKEPPPDLDPG